VVSEFESSPVFSFPDDGPRDAVIQATVTIVAHPNQRQAVLEALGWLLAGAAGEVGCLRRRLYEDVETKGSFTFVEEWATAADFQRRLRSAAYLRLLQIMELSAEPPEVRFLEVVGTKGMEVVHAAREVGRDSEG
jgi:quinol monooxygenase YgiN